MCSVYVLVSVWVKGNESQSSRAVGPCCPHVCAQPEALVLGRAASHAGVRLGLSGREEWEGGVGRGCESACCRALRPVTAEGRNALIEPSPSEFIMSAIVLKNQCEKC